MPINGSVMLSRDEQPRNAEDPMLVTLSGIVILVSFVQPSNAESPMLVTLSGIVILVSPVQSLNAELSILVPPFITTTFKFVFGIRDIAIVGIVAFSMLVQPSNTETPILVTLFGMVMLVSPVQL